MPNGKEEREKREKRKEKRGKSRELMPDGSPFLFLFILNILIRAVCLNVALLIPPHSSLDQPPNFFNYIHKRAIFAGFY